MEFRCCNNKHFSYQCDQCNNYSLCSHEEPQEYSYAGIPAEESDYYEREELYYPKFDW